jgi:transposase
MKLFNQKTKDIAKAYGVSEKTITRMIDDGTFTHGDQWIDLRGKNAINRNPRFNLEACQKYFLTPPEKR